MILRLTLLLISLFWAVAAAAQSGNYQIRPGDTLRVEVLEDSQLNRSVLVLPDGNISFPMAGTLPAAGRTVDQVERSIASKIEGNFAARPNVYVAVIGIPEAPAAAAAPAEPVDETVIVYVLGEVNSPGPKSVLPGTTVLQLLSQSGGFTKFAATKRLQLRRKDTNGRERMFKINYRKISQGASLQSDVVLREGDVLLIPERRLFE